jgi:ATP-binding cassette subfamily B protein RaxB
MSLQLRLRWAATRPPRKVPVILQSEATECGLACLAMILSFYDRPCDVRSLRDSFSTSPRGVTLRRLIEIACCTGLRARPLRVELEYTSQLQLPCLLHWGLLHYVVLIAIKGGKYIIHDPAVGRRAVGPSEFSRTFTGVAVEFETAETRRPTSLSRRVTWRSFFAKALKRRAEIGAILSFALLLELLQIVAPFYLQWTVDWVIEARDASMRNVLVIVFAGVLLAQATAGFLRSIVLLGLGARVHLAWLTDVFAHALRLPLSFFERRYLSDIAGRFEGISYIQRCITSGFLEMLLDGLMSFGLLTMMFVFSTRLAVASASAIGSALLVRFFLMERLRDSMRAHETFHARQQGYFLETIRLESIKLFSAEGLRLAQWANLVNRGQNCHLRTERIQALFRVSNSVIFGAERLFVIWCAARLVIVHAMSLGMLVSYVAYRELLAARAMSLLDRYVEAKTVEVHLDRLSDIALAEPEEEGAAGMVRINDEPAEIEFADVWFRYSDDEPWILKGVSGSVTARATIAITGASGSGKSTLLKILQGLLKPTKGSVMVNGTPIVNSLPSYRRRIGSVTQGADLLMGTIAENISFFDAPVDFALVQSVARMAQIDADIESMPMGYNTVVTDAGASLSGGQKQRLLLARALYKRPQIIFLDEATSHLDVNTEQLILDLVKQLPMTRIVVAHRPETTAACDRAVRLENGVLKTVSAFPGCSQMREANYANV